MGRLAVAMIVSLLAIPTSFLVYQIVTEPYMDEIFHIPQAQQYCKGNFWIWDPMITTPPGLYYLSLAHVACLFPGMFLVRVVSSFSELCSTAILRSVNGALAVLCSIIIYDVIIHLRPTFTKRKAAFFSVILALYPLHWFFTFLYYTDVASLTAVLGMYLACLKNKYHLSALLGVIAVFIRQTNIVWMLFVACTGVIDITLARQNKNGKVDELKESSKGTGQLYSGKSVTEGSNIRKRNTQNTMKANTYLRVTEMSNIRKRNTQNTMKANTYLRVTEMGSSKTHSSGFLDEIRELCTRSWRMKWKLVLHFSPFLLVLVGFVAFVRWNGSVVLGAKEAHVVSPHFAQIMYFGFVSALLTAPLHLSFGQAAHLSRSFSKNKSLSCCLVLAALTVVFLSVHFFSISHPYLLADNRHYTFYLWRKVIKAHWLMLVPLYAYSWFSIFSILGRVRQKVWVLAYFLATTAVLVPAPLIEFRYYTIPFYFFILNSHINDYRSLIIVGMMFVMINVFTMAMFLFRPFYWNHEPGVQRFIW